ncbi:response regulator transcription factor [Undibacterium sp. 14-3-2]|uniref:response regulator transcription factor n=1 Tax=Undibacterium sp. 14-3-2 TaxID=2800129 RepID=UPI0019088B91|nr:response regulator [Undibacterium sp. 14-3-2]MBK1889149.1 response regulator transcription factor [Undibacterium sp. 14-3-2]
MSTESAFLVHVIDDDTSVRTAISLLLLACGYRVFTYESGTQFLECSVPDEPSCILLDVNMLGFSGLQLQEQLKAKNSHIPIIFLTAYGDISMSVRAMKAGAENFLSKPVSKDELVNAIEEANRRYMNVQIARSNLNELRLRYDHLTEREITVFHMVVRGLLNKQIAFQLGNSERTIKAQRSSIMEKMQANSFAELVLIATQLGILGTEMN